MSSSHEHYHNPSNIKLKTFVPLIFSLILLAVGILLDARSQPNWFEGTARLGWYLIAYLPVGLPVLKDAVIHTRKGAVFSEFFLMGIATIGAFAIEKYPEGVAVMLFYRIGEYLQDMAVSKATGNIKALLAERPDEATVLDDDISRRIKASDIAIGSVLQLKPGEKLALDGELLSDQASFNTAAITGESRPTTFQKGEQVLAGMINLNSVSLVKANTGYSDSKLSRIIELVQNAIEHKAPTELFIRKFAKVYTPIVVFLAVTITLLPYFLVADYVFKDWLYRALIFLVIACPCALVISIPLGYFGGVGAGSRNGILFKGSNFLDVLAKIETVVFDKTGTLTEGVFKVQKVEFDAAVDPRKLLTVLNTLESYSSHPIATAVRDYVGSVDHQIKLTQVKELPGLGLKAEFEGRLLLAGNFKLLDKFGVHYDFDHSSETNTIIAISLNGNYVGYLTISDQIKPDAKPMIAELRSLGISTALLSGDKSSIVKKVAGELAIPNHFGSLMPEEKVDQLLKIRDECGAVAFVGDGLNDAPVVAVSDVGMAMGGLGSDATIETADVVILDDNISKIPVAIRIGKETKRVVWQNIGFAFGVKLIVLILGAGGLATMWEAVFADVGVALLAILNAVRIQRMRFK